MQSLSEDQLYAVRRVQENSGPFFLTGEAGTGKSFVINYLRDNVPGCVVTATTGAAAQLVKGRTLHSFAGIHPIHGVLKSRKADCAVQDCDLLVIDEISMMSEEVLIQLFERFDYAGNVPKLLMVGDFLQLPPVKGTKLFESDMWPMVETLKLTTPHRQEDEDFLAILGDVRRGDLSERVREFVSKHTADSLPDDCVHLMSRKKPVEDRNNCKLRELPGELCRSNMQVLVPCERRSPSSSEIARARFPRQLLLKPGARVVLLTNEPSGRWVNGSSGEVADISHGCVTVDLDSGSTVEVSKEDEEVLDGDGQVACIIRQYPMLLAWALTIHRSQGATIDRAGIDLSGHFETGQTYVAMSRCKTASGLFLTGRIETLMTDPKALALCG